LTKEDFFYKFTAEFDTSAMLSVMCRNNVSVLAQLVIRQSVINASLAQIK